MSEKTKWITDVPVATIWTSPESPREIDQQGLKNPIDLNQWYEDLTFDIRKVLCTDNLVQSQLLYGEEVLIDEIKDGWAKVIAVKQPSKKDERGYPGWVPFHQLREVSSSDWTSDEIALVTTPKGSLLDNNKQFMFEVSYLTYLPVVEKSEDVVKVKTPSGFGFLKNDEVTFYPSIYDVPKGDGKALVKAAEPFLELPYFWGGMSSFGYDCSGLAYNVHKANGYEIPRDASDQAKSGREVSQDALQIGDLLFFQNLEKGNIHHVGIYYGDGKMIHSALTRRGLEITPLEGTRYEKEFCGARRYFQ